MFKTLLARLIPSFVNRPTMDPNNHSTTAEDIAGSTLLDPNCCMKVNLYRYLYESWAKDSSDPMATLLRFEVQTITHSKSPKNTEHEYLIAETTVRDDPSREPRFYVFDRVDSMKTLAAENPLSANAPTLGQKLKKLGSSVVSLVPSFWSEEELRSTEEGSFSASSSSLSSIDRSTVLMTQGADVLLTLDKAKPSAAEDRVRGHGRAFSLHFHGQIAQYFKPNDLSLFELVCMAEVVHNLHPLYAVQAEQCYFYAGLVYEATKQHFGIRPSDNADKGKGKAVLYDIDGHLPDSQGRYGGIKVCHIVPGWATSAVSEYKEMYPQRIAKVCCSFPTIQTDFTDV